MATEHRDRWSAWQDAVLCRCDDPSGLAALIAERRARADSDTGEAQDVAKAIEEWRFGKTSDNTGAYRITREEMREILVKAGTIEPGISKRAAHSVVSNMLGSHGPLAGLVDSPGRLEGSRFWLWTPPMPDIPV